MPSNPQKRSSSETQELRRDAGKLLKYLREKAGYSQRGFAAEIAASDYTFVSQIETGRARVPPDQVRVWAKVLGLEAREFALMLMRFYDPETFAIIFEGEPGIFDGSSFSEFLEANLGAKSDGSGTMAETPPALYVVGSEAK